MRSIFLRYFFMVAMLLLFSFAVLGVSFLTAAANTVTEQRLDTLTRCSSEVCLNAAKFVSEGAVAADEDLKTTLTTLAATLDAHVMVCDTSGKVVICSDPLGVSHVGERLPAPVVTAALQGGAMLFERVAFLSDERQTVALGLVKSGGSVCGITAVSASAARERNLLTVFSRTYLLSSLIVLLVAVFSVYGTTRIMARPLRDMAACAQNFAQGNFTARVNRWVQRGDEVGELACAFNAMADALSKQEDLRRGFIANVSHELKTPMTIIAGYIGGLLDGTIPPERETETLNLVRDEVLRLSRLVSSMTRISMLQSGGPDEVRLKSFDICEMTMRALLGMEGSINEKELEVELVLPEQQVAYVLSEPDGMVQVLTNLLDNAVKFSDRGGRLTVSIARSGGQYIISVLNTGPVIPPREIPYIFDRFHKTDRSRSMDRGGLGLGLYLVKNILGAQKVDIFVRSENGETEFRFALPEGKPDERGARKPEDA